MNRMTCAGIAVAMLLSGGCTQDSSTPQTGAPQVAASRSAAAQSSGPLIVFDMVTPGERRTVSPNWAAINAQPLGSQGNPVRTLMPQGQQAYLRRLVCPDGTTPAFRRIRNVGPGPYTTIVDAYDVRCGATSQTVYLDMYHPNYIEPRAVPGFTLRP